MRQLPALKPVDRDDEHEERRVPDVKSQFHVSQICISQKVEFEQT